MKQQGHSLHSSQFRCPRPARATKQSPGGWEAAMVSGLKKLVLDDLVIQKTGKITMFGEKTSI